MTLELWLIAGATIIVIAIAGGTIGIAVFAVGLDWRYRDERKRALEEQAEAHKIEMRELAGYNSRLEMRVSELEAQLAVMFQALKDARIPVPKTGPLISVTAGRDAGIGGDIVARDKRE